MNGFGKDDVAVVEGIREGTGSRRERVREDSGKKRVECSRGVINH